MWYPLLHWFWTWIECIHGQFWYIGSSPWSVAEYQYSQTSWNLGVSFQIPSVDEIKNEKLGEISQTSARAFHYWIWRFSSMSYVSNYPDFLLFHDYNVLVHFHLLSLHHPFKLIERTRRDFFQQASIHTLYNMIDPILALLWKRRIMSNSINNIA